MKPMAVDLCCGLGGWSDGLLAEGWDVVGFDVERHVYGEHRYPAQLVLQDIRTLVGSQFRGKVSLIVASPPCQKYSYMAMPWSKAKAQIAWYRDPAHPERLVELNALVDACFRIAKEAECPIILENVRGAQPWIGRARWNYGSFALWGDVPALMPMTKQSAEAPGHSMNPGEPKWNMHHTECVDSAIIKGAGGGWFNDNKRSGKSETTGYLSRTNGKSPARKAASALIAKIPLPLARYIGATFKPLERAA